MIAPGQISAAPPEWVALGDVARGLGIAHAVAQRKAMFWRTRQVPGQGRGGVVTEVEVASLPAAVRARLWPLGLAAPQANEPGLARLTAAPDWARERALARAALLQALEERLPRGGQTNARQAALARYAAGVWLPELKARLGEVSYPSYMRWLKAWRADGLAGLLPRHQGRSAEVPPDVAARARELALGKPRAAAQVHEFLAAEFGRRCPSYSTINRIVNQVRDEHREECLYLHKGPNAHKHQQLPALGDSAAKAAHPNHFWEIDTSPADIMDINGRRHKLFGIVDVYTRRYHLRLHPAASGMSVAQTLRSAILAWGLPDELVMDNGLDYQSKRVQGLCEELGIVVPFVAPYAPERKPHVERAFRTISKKVFGELTGYTGNCLLTRPEEIVCRYTAEQIQGVLDRWVETYWHERVNGKTGRRPREAAGERIPRRVSDERVLDLLLGEADTRVLRTDGIHYRNRRYWHDRLLELAFGSEVLLREDYADVGRIYVYHGGQYFCTAVDLELLGLSPAEYSERQKTKIRLAKAKVAAIKATLSEDPDQPIHDFLRRKAAEAPATLPGPSKIVPFPSLEPAAAAMPTAAQRAAEPEPEPTPAPAWQRPAWFDGPDHRYEWTLRAEAAGADLDAEDLAWRAEYETTREYLALAEYWASLRRTLERQAAAGGD